MMKILLKLLLVLTIGLITACADDESTGQAAPIDTTNISASESGISAPDPSGAPVTDEPVAPVTDEPVVPVTDEPVVPVTNEPVVPVTNEPVVPVTDELVVPVTNEPVVPVTNESVVPVTDESVVPVTDEPVVPVTDEPVVDVSVSESNCIDLVSANADWSDNCVLSVDQPYMHSTYLLGVQRILWCAEAFSDSTLTIAQSTDGIYAGKTEEAVRRYQSRHDLPSSGSVDSSTWLQFQQELILIGAAAGEYSSFSIVGARCGEQIHFYQRNTQPLDWKIAAQPGSTDLLDFTGLELDQ